MKVHYAFLVYIHEYYLKQTINRYIFGGGKIGWNNIESIQLLGGINYQ